MLLLALLWALTAAVMLFAAWARKRAVLNWSALGAVVLFCAPFVWILSTSMQTQPGNGAGLALALLLFACLPVLATLIGLAWLVYWVRGRIASGATRNVA